MYQIDSCLEKVKRQRYNVCNQPSLSTVCYKPIVRRNILTRDAHLNILSTPKGFIWNGIKSYYKKFDKNNNNKLKTLDKLKWLNLRKFNFQNSHKQGDEHDVYGSKNLEKTNQRKYKRNKENRDNNQNMIINRNQQNYQKIKKTDDISISNIYSEDSIDANIFNKDYRTKKLRILKRKHLTKSYFNPTNTESEMTTNNGEKSPMPNKIIIKNIKNKYNNQKQKKINKGSVPTTYSVNVNKLNKYHKTRILQKKWKNEISYELKNEDNTLIQKEEINSIDILKKEQDHERDNLLEKKKKLWLLAEKKRKKREERENKFNSSLQAKQKTHEELKKKIKAKRKRLLEEKQRKNKKKNEKIMKTQVMTEKQILQERTKQRKEAENNLKLKILELEAQKIIEEEEAWRNKINQQFAQKMGYKINSKNHVLPIIPIIVNNKDELKMGEIGKNKIIQYTKNQLEEIKRNDQVFDPGNLMKQIIIKELNIAKTRQVSLKKKLQAHNNESFKKNKITKTIEIKDKNGKQLKSVVFRKHDGFHDINYLKHLHNKVQVELYENCIPNKQSELKYRKPAVKHCNSNISLNTVVCHWKNEVADMKTNMQNRRYNFVQNAIANNMWKY